MGPTTPARTGVAKRHGSLEDVSSPTFRGDPYRVLDVRHDASAEEIKLRWRELAREHHPDRAGADAEEREQLTGLHTNPRVVCDRAPTQARSESQ